MNRLRPWNVVSGLLILVLLSVSGALALRVADLSQQVDALSTMTTTAPTATNSSTTSTSVDVWRGNRISYLNSFAKIRTKRNVMVEAANAATEARKLEGQVEPFEPDPWYQKRQEKMEQVKSETEDLIDQISRLPTSPPAVQQTQDTYQESVMELYLATRDLVTDYESSDRRARYYKAWEEEWQRWVLWSQDVERTR